MQRNALNKIYTKDSNRSCVFSKDNYLVFLIVKVWLPRQQMLLHYFTYILWSMYLCITSRQTIKPPNYYICKCICTWKWILFYSDRYHNWDVFSCTLSLKLVGEGLIVWRDLVPKGIDIFIRCDWWQTLHFWSSFYWWFASNCIRPIFVVLLFIK